MEEVAENKIVDFSEDGVGVMGTEKLVEFTDETKQQLISHTGDMIRVANVLRESLLSGSLDESTKRVIPSLLEKRFTEMASLLDYGTYLEEQRRERTARIREANIKIKTLEEKLAHGRSTDGLSEQVCSLYDIVCAWWRKDGFQHVNDFCITWGGNVRVDFSFYADDLRGTIVGAPEHIATHGDNGKKRIDQVSFLVNQGFELIRADGNSTTWLLLDTQKNRELVTRLVTDRFPSAKILEFQSHRKEPEDDSVFVIRGMEVYIYEIGDIPGGEEH